VTFLDFLFCSILVMKAFWILRKSGTERALEGANGKSGPSLVIESRSDSNISSFKRFLSSSIFCMRGNNFEFCLLTSAFLRILYSLSCSSRSIIILNLGMRIPQGMFLARNWCKMRSSMSSFMKAFSRECTISRSWNEKGCAKALFFARLASLLC